MKSLLIKVTGIFIIALIVIIPLFIWVGCRIDPPKDNFALLVHKMGKNPDPNQIIAAPDEKGIQLEVLPEGRYFYNPLKWEWHYFPITDIPAGQLGVKTRLYGKDLPPGEILAKEGTKGILPEVLTPGKYRINPVAYNVQNFNATTIQPGHIGVQVSLVGEDPLTGKPKETNTFIVEDNEKGVIAKTLDPGTYYLNPYRFSVIPVNLQSNRFEMAGEDAIDFLTLDGFTVRIEGTIEYAVSRDKSALLTHEVGDLDDILHKIILPRARGFARIEGSKGKALNYIEGEMRQQFQDKLTQHLQTGCGNWGVEIRSVLIRNISPPDEISSVVRDRELANQAAKMYGQQIEQAISRADLARQEKLAEQNKEKVDAETIALQARIKAEQEAAVRLKQAQQGLSVATLQKEAAEEQAKAIIAKAEGTRQVTKAGNEADTNVLKVQSLAFGDGKAYARYLFLEKMAPNIKSVLTNDNPSGLGGLFNMFLNEPQQPTKSN